jgi:hypothetical protein
VYREGEFGYIATDRDRDRDRERCRFERQIFIVCLYGSRGGAC